ncbi:hypothetical protein JCM11641_005544 [Rhodosporidiobolus odoratus]
MARTSTTKAAASSSAPIKKELCGLAWPDFYSEMAAEYRKVTPGIKGRQIQKRAGAAYRRMKAQMAEEEEEGK